MEWEVRFTGAPNSAPNYAELLDENTATKILKDPWVMNHFFPSGLCTMHPEWYPMKVTPRNMQRLARANHVVATMVHQGRSQGQRQVKAISFGQMILLPCGEIYALFFRGDKMTDFKDHVIYHLGIFSKIRNPTLDTFVQLNYPLDFQVDDVKFEMKRYLNKYL